MKFGAWLDSMNGLEHFARRACGQHVASGLRHAGEDCCHLRCGLAGGKNHFGHPGAQRAVVIEFGEAQVFEWQIDVYKRQMLFGSGQIGLFAQARID